MKSKFEACLGQAGQELSIEVCKLGRIIWVRMPNTHTRVRKSCPLVPRMY